MPKLTRQQLTRHLLEVCEQHSADPPGGAIIPEPYIPFLPKRWNRILVLAEAQNMSKKNARYVAGLRKLSRRDRFQRLGKVEWEGLGIQPWDDDTLPLALAAIFPGDSAKQYAVSNAVLWSRRGKNDRDAKPNREQVKKSIAFWKEALPLLQPKLIVCAGFFANKVIGEVWDGNVLVLRSPSQRALSPSSGWFPQEALLAWLPAVNAALEKFPEIVKALWEPNKVRDGRNKMWYACHAVLAYQASPGSADD